MANESVEASSESLLLLARIREAVGDPEGRLMQDELLERIQSMASGLRVIATWAKCDESSGDDRGKAMRDIYDRAMQSLSDVTP